MDVAELAPGLWRWTARHPAWRPDAGWEPEVACFYAETDDATLLVDPLVPAGEEERFWAALDRDVERCGRPVGVLLTAPWHRRSADVVAARYGAALHHPVHPRDELPGGVRVLEMPVEASPLYLPSHRALAVGDMLTEVAGELRVWWELGDDDDVRLFRERHVPALRRWLELPVDHVLIAHGAHVAGGRSALAAALARPPWHVVDQLGSSP